MTPGEFQRSLDAFPLEYQAIVDRHVRIDGEDLDRQRSRSAATICGGRAKCRRKAHLIHLRQGWIEAGGHAGEQAELLERSARRCGRC